MNALENFSKTYFSLGLAVAGSQKIEEDGFSYCRSPLPHPVCNFALAHDLDPWSVRRLRDLAAEADPFPVYFASGKNSDHADALLKRTGFQVAYQLVQMDADPVVEEIPVQVVEAHAIEEKGLLASFMIDQFFARQPASFRRVVAQATADSGLSIEGFYEQGQLAAAMMLCVTPDCVGVYNLGVRSARRNRGIGSNMIRSALTRGKQLTLQCEESLVPWYVRLGFRQSGILTVYSFQKA